MQLDMHKRGWRKGQEEAPIELLIAVTLLTFVIVIGFSVYQNMCRNQFEQKVKSSIHSLVSTIESVYRGSIGSSQSLFVDFSVEACGKLDAIRFFSDAKLTCNKQVGYSDCIVIAATIWNKDDKSNREILMSEAMNVPNSVRIYYDDPKLGEIDACGSQADFWGIIGQDLSNPGFSGANSFTITKKDSNTILISRS